MQASVERRFVNGLLFQMNYMWSHGITDASIGSGEAVSFENANCRACDRSDTNIDVRHTLTINGVYQLPFGPGKALLGGNGIVSRFLGGWSLAGMASARTGLPLNITISRKASALPDGNTSGQRPNLVPGVSLYPAHQSIYNWLNPAAFAIPANGTWGNLGRYARERPRQLRDRQLRSQRISRYPRPRALISGQQHSICSTTRSGAIPQPAWAHSAAEYLQAASARSPQF